MTDDRYPVEDPEDYRNSDSYQLGYAHSLLEDFVEAKSWDTIRRYQKQARRWLERENKRREARNARIEAAKAEEQERAEQASLQSDWLSE